MVKERKVFPLFEWSTAMMMLLMAVTMVFYPRTIENSSFKILLDTGIPAAVMMVLYGVIGVIRLFSLAMNGLIWYGSYLRGLGAGVSAILWGQMSVALALRTFETDSISLGVSVYFVLCVGELIALYRVCRTSRLIALFTLERVQ